MGFGSWEEVDGTIIHSMRGQDLSLSFLEDLAKVPIFSWDPQEILEFQVNIILVWSINPSSIPLHTADPKPPLSR